MAEKGTVEKHVGYLSDCEVSLMECCICRTSLHDPVMLNCLHHCCRSCLEPKDTAGTHRETTTLACPVCFEAIEPRAVVANSFLCNRKRLTALYLDALACSTCDTPRETVEFWCADCCMGLCCSCYSWHNKFHRSHRSIELEVARTWSFSQLTPAPQCNLHKQLIEKQCFTCHQPRCLKCSESCKTGGHDMQPCFHEATSKHVSRLTYAITSAKAQLNRLLSGLQQNSRSVARGIREACKSKHILLVRRKRSLQDSTKRDFDRSLTEVFVNLQRVWNECTNFMEKPRSVIEAATCAARHVDLLSLVSARHLHLLQVRHLLKTIVGRYDSSCRSSIRRLLDYRQNIGTFVIDTSAPLTADIVLSGCLGATDRRRAAPAAPLLFGQPCVSFTTPVDCVHVALTRDGLVLIAAGPSGLLAYNDRGQLHSRWLPPMLSNVRDDQVHGVAALSDGRVAVSVGWAQLVVLLRHSGTRGDSWLEDRRLTVLQSSPWRLAGHGNLLAVTECKYDDQRQYLVPDHHVQLIKLSSGQLLYRQSREYDITDVALTALCVVTTSDNIVKRNSGVRPYLIDAFSHAGEFLWRYETNDDEGVVGVCSADTWSHLYVAVMEQHGRSSRVMAIGGADGRDQRDVISSKTHGLLLPGWLSLARGQRRTMLVVVSMDRAGKQLRTVTIYEAKPE